MIDNRRTGQGPITKQWRRGLITEKQRQEPITEELITSEQRRGPLTEEQDRDR
jgi:hypothetical protein